LFFENNPGIILEDKTQRKRFHEKLRLKNSDLFNDLNWDYSNE
jgi:hypothetical protein